MKRLPAGWFHSMSCAIDYARSKSARAAELKAKKEKLAKEKAERLDFKERKRALKSKADLRREAQAAFNAFIRARDLGKECCSCKTRLKHKSVGGGYDAGHYLSRGARGDLIFDEDNCHGQCKKCNRYLSGNCANYRIKLIKRIGLDRVEQLENSSKIHRETREYLEDVKAEYKLKLKNLGVKQ